MEALLFILRFVLSCPLSRGFFFLAQRDRGGLSVPSCLPRVEGRFPEEEDADAVAMKRASKSHEASDKWCPHDFVIPDTLCVVMWFLFRDGRKRFRKINCFGV